jgi:hypothetical protein
VNPAPSRLQAGEEEGSKQRRFEMPTSTEEGAGFGGWNGLGTNVAFGPPAVQIGSWWPNLTRLNHDVQQLLVRVIFLGGITADQCVATKQNGLFGPTVSVRRPQESGWLAKVTVKPANVRD